MKKIISRLIFYFITVVVICNLSSCLSSKNIAYFNNISRDTIEKIDAFTEQAKITKNDILQITVTSTDIATSQIFNNNVSVAGASGLASGYLVDESGYIKLPQLGPIKAADLTKDELEKQITNLLVTGKLALSPIVTVRIINYKITVLGEVTRPGVISIPNELVTLPEALGMAGDLTVFGKRNNVLLIREINGKRIYKRFSLSENQMFNKDLYYLQNKDILYIEPSNARSFATDRTAQVLPIILSSLSILIIIFTQLIRR